MAGQAHPQSSPPSSPLSVLSQSPSPPSPALSPSLPPTLTVDTANRYPSPSLSSTMTSGSASPRKTSDMGDSGSEIQVRTDGPPPPKRRRLATPPKPRTTTYIDLENRTGEEDDDEDEKNLERLLTALRQKKRIIVIAGAGMSVSAGIPDFRSTTGLFTTLRGQHGLKASGKHLFDASVYKHDSSTSSFHTMVRELASMTSNARPTAFHHMLASLAHEGRLMRLYTQNIDTLETQMKPLATNVPLNTKGPWPVTIQLHGGLEKMVCTKCSHIESFNAALFEGPEAPLCEKCKEQDQVRTTFAGKRSHGIGRLRPRIVLYNEYNPDEEAIGNVSKADLRRVPDAVIVVGTTLKIPGVRRLVKELCQLTRSRRDGITAWLNIDPEPQGAEFKDCWDLVVRAKCDDIAELVNLPRWDQQDIGDRESYMVTGDEQKMQQCAASLSRDRIAILLERKRKRVLDDDGTAPFTKLATPKRSRLVDQVQSGIPTPSASPRHRSPLPTTKATTKTTSKQTTLVFNGSTGAGAKTVAPSASASAPTKKATAATKRKPRQSKKEAAAAKPLNRLNRTFKATKGPSALTKDAETRKNQRSADRGASDLSSPPSVLSLGLPSLRPTEKARPAPLKLETMELHSGLNTFAASSPPTTPTTQHALTINTVSPTCKPRSMGTLID